MRVSLLTTCGLLLLAGCTKEKPATSIQETTRDVTAVPDVEVTFDDLPKEPEKPRTFGDDALPEQAEEVIKFDLYVQGFSFVGEADAQYLISGSANGNLTARASDKFNKASLVNKSYTGASLRRQAHTFADDFVKALGRKGFGASKIAYKADKGASGEICIADFDGGGAQTITSDKVIVAAPD